MARCGRRGSTRPRARCRRMRQVCRRWVCCHLRRLPGSRARREPVWPTKRRVSWTEPAHRSPGPAAVGRPAATVPPQERVLRVLRVLRVVRRLALQRVERQQWELVLEMALQPVLEREPPREQAPEQEQEQGPGPMPALARAPVQEREQAKVAAERPRAQAARRAAARAAPRRQAQEAVAALAQPEPELLPPPPAPERAPHWAAARPALVPTCEAPAQAFSTSAYRAVASSFARARWNRASWRTPRCCRSGWQRSAAAP